MAQGVWYTQRAQRGVERQWRREADGRPHGRWLMLRGWAKERYDSTAKDLIAMQTGGVWARARALEEATRREDEGFWSLGSVGSSSC